MPNQYLHIALAFDENFINQFYALASSIFTNNQKNSIFIHAITSGVNDDEKSRILSFASNSRVQVAFYSVPPGFGQDFVMDGNWTATTYYRLLLSQLLPAHVEKYLYIDTDCLVVGDLQPLFQVNLGSNVLAAVRDRLVPIRPDLDILKPFSYFNAGVLLINRKLWIEQEITPRAIKFLTDYPEKIKYVDQDALNYLLKDNWLQLDVGYNLMFADIPDALPKSQYSTFLSKVTIIHFTQHRPWHMLCRNPFRHLYHLYLNRSNRLLKGKYMDYSLGKVPAFLKIQLVEFYLDSPILRWLWKVFK